MHWFFALAIVACSSGPAGETVAGGNGAGDGGSALADGGGEADRDGSALGDGGDGGAPPSDAAPPAEAGTVRCAWPSSPAPPRGTAWTRAQPMFVSGLTVGMPAPSASDVADYFDAFGATAVHTWETGLPSRVDAWRAANHASFRYVSWVHKDGTSPDNGKFLGGIAANTPGRIGFQIGDEPANDADLDTMLAAAQGVRAVDPDALVIVNFADNAAADGLLTRAAAHADVDVLSVDNYTYKDGGYTTLERVRTHALAAHKPYWRYADSFAYASGDTSPSESDMRWDAMVGLVYGFTGLTWFVYEIDSPSDLLPELFASGGTFSSAKTTRFAWASAINRELLHLGGALAQLESTDVRYVAGTPLLQPKGTTAFAPGAGGHPYLSSVSTGNGLDDAHLGFFRDACGEPYVLVLNPAHAQGKFPLSLEHTITVHLGFDFSSANDPTLDETSVDALDPHDGVVKSHALTAAGSHRASLDVTLAPGAVFLFKPHDARVFAGQ